MMTCKKLIKIAFLCLFLTLLIISPAYAADVLSSIKSRAVDLLKNLKPVIYVLAGFGLVGFAWGAIFNKISWKWFANIAMGLFLVANMGLFIDYFVSKDGQKGAYSQDLGFGDYTKDGYSGIPGTDSKPGGQKPGSNEGAGGKSDSDDLGNDFGEHGLGKGEIPLSQFSDEESCSKGGGQWKDNKCTSSAKSSISNDAAYASFGDEGACGNAGGIWSGEKCGAPKPNGESLAGAEGGVDENYAAQLECATTGGTWMGTSCVGDANEAQRSCGKEGGKWDASAKKCNVSEDTAKQSSDCYRKGGSWNVNKCEMPGDESSGNSAKNNDKDGYEGYSKMGCEKSGGTFDINTGLCKGVKASALSDDDEDDEEDEPKKEAGFDEEPGDGAVSAYGCQKIGGTWDDDAGKCNTANKENPSNKAKEDCVSKNGTWTAVDGCVDKETADRIKKHCADQGLGWTGGMKCSASANSGAEDPNKTPPASNDADAAKKAACTSKGGEWRENNCTSKETKKIINGVEYYEDPTTFPPEYINSKTGERMTRDEFQKAVGDGGVKDAEVVRENDAKADCIRKSSQGYEWVNGKCITPEEVAKNKEQAAKETDANTKKYCPAGQEYAGMGDMTGPICVDNAETKAKKKAEADKNKAAKEACAKKPGYVWTAKNKVCVNEAENNCLKQTGMEWKNGSCQMTAEAKKKKELSEQAKTCRAKAAEGYEWKDNKCEKTAKGEQQAKYLRNPEIVKQMEKDYEACDDAHNDCYNEASSALLKYTETNCWGLSDAKRGSCQQQALAIEKRTQDGCGARYDSCVQKVKAMESQMK